MTEQEWTTDYITPLINVFTKSIPGLFILPPSYPHFTFLVLSSKVYSIILLTCYLYIANKSFVVDLICNIKSDGFKICWKRCIYENLHTPNIYCFLNLGNEETHNTVSRLSLDILTGQTNQSFLKYLGRGLKSS